MDVNITTTKTSFCDEYLKYLTVELLSGRVTPSFFGNDSWTDECFSQQPRNTAASSLFDQMLADSSTQLLSSSSDISVDVHIVNSTRQSNQDSFIPYFNLYISGYTTLVAASIGFVINVVGIYLMSRRQGHKNIFNIMFIINLISDTTYLAFQTIRSVHTHFMSFASPLSSTYYILTNSGERFTYITSVLMLVALTHSRYQAATRPHDYRELTLFWSKRRNQLIKYLLPTFLVATCFIIPIMWEIDNEIVFSSEDITVQVIPSEIRLNNYYHMFLIGILNLVLLGVYPFISFLYYGYHILKTLNQQTTFTESPPQQRRRCNKASKTLFAMIFTFIILHSLRIATNIGELIILFAKNKNSDHELQHERGTPNWLEIVATLSDICMVVNASINYVIYHYLN